MILFASNIMNVIPIRLLALLSIPTYITCLHIDSSIRHLFSLLLVLKLLVRISFQSSQSAVLFHDERAIVLTSSLMMIMHGKYNVDHQHSMCAFTLVLIVRMMARLRFEIRSILKRVLSWKDTVKASLTSKFFHRALPHLDLGPSQFSLCVFFKCQ